LANISSYQWLFLVLIMVSNLTVAGTRNVFGPDHRTKVTSEKFPWRSVGKLKLPDDAWCTATLVGEDLILTAAHCIIDDKTHTLSKGTFTFLPGYANGDSNLSATVDHFWWGTSYPSYRRNHDWAIGRISEKLGEKLGWLGVDPLDISANLNQPKFNVSGYSGDFQDGEVAAAHVNCEFTGYSSWKGLAFHKCDMTRGASGAAIFYSRGTPADTYVVAVNVAEYREGGEESLVGIPYTADHANIAVPASDFVDTIKKIKSRP
jgi:protease YdgD